MALIEVNFCSSTLNRNTQLTVVMPEKMNGVGVKPGYYRENHLFPCFTCSMAEAATIPIGSAIRP